MAGKNLRKVHKAAVMSLLWAFRPQTRNTRSKRRPGRPLQECKDLKTTSLEGKVERSSAYIKDEESILLRDVELIHER